MTSLRIELNNIPETVSAAIIHKLYEIALLIQEPNVGEEDDIYLSGNLLSTNSYKYECDYLTDRFTDLSINTTGNYYIKFRDAEVQRICSTTWGDGIGCFVNNVKNVQIGLNDSYFSNNTNIVNLDLSAFENIQRISTWASDNILNVYIGGLTALVNLNTLLGRNWNGSATINKLIIGELVSNFINGESITSGTNTINIFGIKLLSSNLTLGDYSCRRLVINKFYLGEVNYTFSLSSYMNLSGNGGIGILYVPSTMVSYYEGILLLNSSLIGSVQPYDFTTDPDGIFAELEILY